MIYVFLFENDGGTMSSELKTVVPDTIFFLGFIM